MLRDYLESCVRLTFDDIPASVIKKTKLSILDTLGVMIRGSREDIVQKISEKLLIGSCSEEASEMVTHKKCSVEVASFINSLAGHVLLFDDEYNKTLLHPGATIIPTLLAVSEWGGYTGKKFISSVIVGYETAIRFSHMLGYKHYALGFSPTGTVSTLGLIVGLAKLLDLNIEQIMVALSIGAQEMGGIRLYQKKGQMNYAMLLGAHASKLALLSINLCGSGLEPFEDFIQLDSLFYTAFSGSQKTGALGTLGDDWFLSDVTYKTYPGSRFCHGIVKEVLNKIRAFNIKYKEILEIYIELDESRYTISNIPQIDNKGQASFSMQYNLASAIIYDKLTLDQFSLSSMENGDVKDLMRKVKLVHSLNLDSDYPEKWTTNIRIKHISGGVYSFSFDALSKMEVTEEEVKAKFLELTNNVHHIKANNKLLEIIDNLESVENVSFLIEYFLHFQ